MKAKNKSKSEDEKQIPFGNDRKKGKDNSKGNGRFLPFGFAQGRNDRKNGRDNSNSASNDNGKGNSRFPRE